MENIINKLNKIKALEKLDFKREARIVENVFDYL
jgi:hypothetical protein